MTDNELINSIVEDMNSSYEEGLADGTNATLKVIIAGLDCGFSVDDMIPIFQSEKLVTLNNKKQDVDNMIEKIRMKFEDTEYLANLEKMITN